MKKSPFEKITKLNAPGMGNAVPMPIEKGFNDDAGRRISLSESMASLTVLPENTYGPKPGKPIIKPVPPKPGVPKPPIKPIKPIPVRPKQK
jgi:hypothetical protein